MAANKIQEAWGNMSPAERVMLIVLLGGATAATGGALGLGAGIAGLAGKVGGMSAWGKTAAMGGLFLGAYGANRMMTGSADTALREKELELEYKRLEGEQAGQVRALEETRRMTQEDRRMAMSMRKEGRQWEVQDRQAQTRMQLLAMMLEAQRGRSASYLRQPRDPIAMTQLLGRY